MKLLDEREKTHGDYVEVCVLAQNIKKLLRGSKNWAKMPLTHKESVDMIASKLARILSGDFDEEDHWQDVAGYAILIVNQIKKAKQTSFRVKLREKLKYGPD